jgi:hypothetical protein
MRIEITTSGSIKARFRAISTETTATKPHFTGIHFRTAGEENALTPKSVELHRYIRTNGAKQLVQCMLRRSVGHDNHDGAAPDARTAANSESERTRSRRKSSRAEPPRTLARTNVPIMIDEQPFLQPQRNVSSKMESPRAGCPGHQWRVLQAVTTPAAKAERASRSCT